MPPSIGKLADKNRGIPSAGHTALAVLSGVYFLPLECTLVVKG